MMYPEEKAHLDLWLLVAALDSVIVYDILIHLDLLLM